MSLRVDLEDALENLRDTLHKLDKDIKLLEHLVADHFSLTSSKPIPKVMQSIEKAISEIKP